MRSLVFLLVGAPAFWAQTWSGSGSDGSDGPLVISASTPGVAQGVYIFDPVALNKDADANNVFHFTTISIQDNITVVFAANRMRRPGPVVFLASGGVTIAGKLSFSGETGHPNTNNDSLRRISIPGPGGYPGGTGGTVAGSPATPGTGPGGGKVASPVTANPHYYRGCPGAYTNAVVPSWCTGATAPSAYGTNLVQPLVGGAAGAEEQSPLTPPPAEQAVERVRERSGSQVPLTSYSGPA